MGQSVDLEAVRQVLNFLEISKNSADKIYDTLPSIFLLIDHKGRIIHGNTVATLGRAFISFR